MVANPHVASLERRMATGPQGQQNCRYLSSSVGVNVAKNHGIKNAQGEILVFLDDDCLLEDANHLKKLDKLFQDPKVDAVGGLYVTPQKEKSLVMMAYNQMSNFWVQQYVGANGQTSQLLGGNSAYRRKIFYNIKFDETVLYGADEIELNRATTQAGFGLFFSEEVKVTHYASRDLKAFFARAKAHAQNRRPRNSSERKKWPVLKIAKEFCGRPITSMLTFTLIALFQLRLISALNSSQERTATPSSRAFSNLDPAASPASK